MIFFIHNVQHTSKNYKICEAEESENREEKNRKVDLQEIQILKLAQKDFKIIINILREQKMRIIDKNIKKSQQKIGIYLKNKIQINKRRALISSRPQEIPK